VKFTSYGQKLPSIGKTVTDPVGVKKSISSPSIIVVQTSKNRMSDDEPLADRIGSWRLHRGLEDLNPTVFSYAGEASSILFIVILDQKTGDRRIGRGFSDLLRDPNITR